MRICVAQTRPVKGDIEANIHSHLKLIGVAVSAETDFMIFPELSITGYEPGLVKELATTQDDVRFDLFQKISDANCITIGIGVPTPACNSVCISQVYLQPGKRRECTPRCFCILLKRSILFAETVT